MKTTANIQYFTHPASGSPNGTDYQISFSGTQATRMEKEWQKFLLLYSERYDALVKHCESQIEDFKNQISITHKSISRPWYRFWYTKREKKKIARINRTQDKINELLKTIEEETINFKQVSTEFLEKVKVFLSKHGFVLVGLGANGTKTIVRTEIWVKND